MIFAVNLGLSVRSEDGGARMENRRRPQGKRGRTEPTKKSCLGIITIKLTSKKKKKRKEKKKKMRGGKERRE